MLESLLAIQRATEQVFRNMEDALVDFVMTGKFNFKDFANSVLGDLARIEAKKLTKMLTGDSSSGGGFMGFIKKILGGLATGGGGSVGTGATTLSNGAIINASGAVYGMAGGGVINEHVLGVGTSSGKSYEFGESGSEVVIPQNKMGSGSKTTNIFIQAVDPRSFTKLVEENPEGIISVVDKSIMENGQLRHSIGGTF